MELNNLILSLPVSVTFSDKESVNEAGLCLRYRTTLKKWTCNYGYHRGSGSKHMGVSDTPIGAVEDFINKIKQYNATK